jgi:hypothetical protein
VDINKICLAMLIGRLKTAYYFAESLTGTVGHHVLPARLKLIWFSPTCKYGINPSVKSLTEHLWFEVPNRRGFVNITSTIEELVQKSRVQEGLCLVNAMHITPCVAHLSLL